MNSNELENLRWKMREVLSEIESTISQPITAWTPRSYELIFGILGVYDGFARADAEREKQRLHSMPYDEYLHTEHWQQMREKVFARKGRRCEKCFSAEKELHVHHITYDRRGYEEIDDLMVLCDECHIAQHNKSKPPADPFSEPEKYAEWETSLKDRAKANTERMGY